MRAGKAKKTEWPRTDAASRVEGPRVGWVASARAGEVRVAFEGSRAGPVAARVAAGIDDAALERAAAEKQEALLVFEGGDPSRPVLVALLRSSTPLTDAILAAPPAGRKVARVDGQRVEIEGREEVVLRCGRASLTLRADGKVVLRGVNVVTQADAVQKIRGGKVEIN